MGTKKLILVPHGDQSGSSEFSAPVWKCFFKISFGHCIKFWFYRQRLPAPAEAKKMKAKM